VEELLLPAVEHTWGWWWVVLGRLKGIQLSHFVPDPSAAEVEVAVGRLKRCKSPGVDQISSELIQAGGETHSEVHKLIKLIWNKEELPHQWKESIVVPVCKKGDKTDCSNYRGLSLLSTSYKILSNIFLSRLTPYADGIIGDHHCGFQHKNQ
jgi:hypothetical protein